MNPKVFISYSWSSPAHQEAVRIWAERLIFDGVDVLLDIFDLKEGDDKYAFMESMVTDPSVTHVIIISDKEYSLKADTRTAGVGTESQIISQEVYGKVKQSKFIPVVCEFDSANEPFLPTFLKTRIWVDFSTPEAINENWEKLIRFVFDKPVHEKPPLGKIPAYIQNGQAAPPSPASSKFTNLKQAILQAKPGLEIYRQDFLDACMQYADSLRTRERPENDQPGAKVLSDCSKLKPIRDHIVDWILLESTTNSSPVFSESLTNLLERMRDIKSRPPEITTWNDSWFEAHSLFVYETFLYAIAALLKSNAYSTIHQVFGFHYLNPPSLQYDETRFDNFGCFYAYSETLQPVLAPTGKRLLSPAAELVKRQADRNDITFQSIMEADLLATLAMFLNSSVRWYPQTLHYASHFGSFPFFLRCTRRRDFRKLSIITGIESADKLRELVKEGHARANVNAWTHFYSDRTFWNAMNMNNLDSLQ